MAARVACYYAPDETDPLWTAGCAWLGRDPASGRRMPARFDTLTEDPRLYGFHATLKPPMRPAHPWATLMDDAAALAARLAPFDLPPLAVMDLGGFLALREDGALPGAAGPGRCLRRRSGPPPHAGGRRRARRRRRRGGRLSPEQDAMLLDWGLPARADHLALPHDPDPPPDGPRNAPRCNRTPKPISPPPSPCPTGWTRSACSRRADSGAPFMLAERLTLGG